MIARPKISQNDLDLTELETIKLWAGGPGSLSDFSTGLIAINATKYHPAGSIIVAQANELVAAYDTAYHNAR